MEGLLLNDKPYVTPVGIAIQDAYMLYFSAPQVRNCNIGILISHDAANDVTTANALTIHGGELQQNSIGMDVSGSFGCVVSGVTIQGSVYGGIILRSLVKGFSIRDCYFESNAQGGQTSNYDIVVGLEAVCTSVLVDGCVFTSPAKQLESYAVSLQKCSGFTMSNSLVWGYQKAAILNVGHSDNVLTSQIIMSGKLPVMLPVATSGAVTESVVELQDYYVFENRFIIP